MPHFLVTGTDTGIGKTTAACAIAAALTRRRHRVGVMKPAETGCATAADGTLIAADGERLAFFARSGDPERVCPHRFSAPLAPAIAARHAGVSFDAREVIADVRGLTATNALTLIEGAGGLLVPLAERATFADLAAACALRLLVVVGNRLGALNHAQLTMAYARTAGLPSVGYVINTLRPDEDLAARTNVQALAELLGPPLGVLPWLGEIRHTEDDRARLADAAERGVDLDALLRDA